MSGTGSLQEKTGLQLQGLSGRLAKHTTVRPLETGEIYNCPTVRLKLPEDKYTGVHWPTGKIYNCLTVWNWQNIQLSDCRKLAKYKTVWKWWNIQRSYCQKLEKYTSPARFIQVWDDYKHNIPENTWKVCGKVVLVWVSCQLYRTELFPFCCIFCFCSMAMALIMSSWRVVSVVLGVTVVSVVSVVPWLWSCRPEE